MLLLTLPRILLRFERLRVVIAYIKAVFKEQSKGASGLNFEGLQEALKILHGPMQRYTRTLLFRLIDSFPGKKSLNYSILSI